MQPTQCALLALQELSPLLDLEVEQLEVEDTLVQQALNLDLNVQEGLKVT
jgi:hypothetical protein